MGGRSAEALARRAEKRGRSVEEQEATDESAHRKKHDLPEPKPIQPAPSKPATSGAHRPRPKHPSPAGQHQQNGWEAQRELNGKLARAGPQDLHALVIEHGKIMNVVNCATALHRLAKCAPNSELRLGHSEGHWKKTWSLALARSEGGVLDETQVDALCARTAARMGAEEVSARSLTSIAWAVAKLRLPHAELLAALSAQAAVQLRRRALDAFGIANVVWALATLREVHEADAALLDACAEAACAMPGAFKPQELTNLLWGFATLKRRHGPLFEAMAATATARIGEFTPQGLSQTVWAYAKLNLAKHTLLLAAADAASPRGTMARYDPQSIATLGWSFANLEVEHGPLLGALSREALARPEAFDGASCAQLLWALSRLKDGVDAKAVAAMARRLHTVSASGEGVNSQQLLYSLGALAKLPAGLLRRSSHE